MSRYCFGICGALTVLLGPASFVSFSPASPVQALRELVLLAAIEILGFGLACQRKWAVLYFSVPLCWFGVRQTFVSTYAVAFPYNLLAMLYGLLLAFPFIVMIRHWRQLT